MKILLVCPYDWETPGGVQVHVRQLAAELGERGHRAIVLAPGSRTSSDERVRIVGRPVRVPYGGTVAPISFSPGSWKRIRSAMRAFDADVIHVHEPLTPSIGGGVRSRWDELLVHAAPGGEPPEPVAGGRQHDVPHPKRRELHGE